MKVFSVLRALDRRFSLGLLLGLIFGVVSIYTAFIYERRPRLTMDVISNTSVLDVSEQLGGLDILFNGSSIKDSHQTLRILLVRVSNDGRLDILIDRFDSRDPLGFSVAPGQIVQPPEVVDASSDYLRRNLQISLRDSVTATISPVIFEAGQYFTLKLLILVAENDIPSLTPFGKIAGIEAIKLSQSYLQRGRPPFLLRTFEGDALVQVVRLIAYSLIGLAFLIIGILIALTGADLLEKNSRRSHVQSYLSQTSLEPPEQLRQAFKLYVSYGQQPILMLLELINDPKLLSRKSSRHEASVAIEGSILLPSDYFALSVPNYSRLIRTLELSGIIERTDTGHLLNEHVRRVLPDFVEYLRKRDAIKPQSIIYSSSGRTNSSRR